jgi:SsrA-binding protein
MDGKIDISSAWVDITDKGLILKQAHIPHYTQSQSFDKDVDPLRERVLLANKNEIKKLGKAIAQKGLTIIPLNVHYSDTKKIKLEIGIARGKKEHDKRDAIKQKDMERDIRRQE